MLVNEDIIFMHAQDAAALWCRRDEAVYRSDRTHVERRRLDNRVNAHLHGLQIAEAAGWDVCKALLALYRGPGEVFAAGVLALSNTNERLLPVLDACVEPANVRAFASAFGWMPFDAVEPLATRWLSSESALERLLAVSAFALHRQDPGPRLVAQLDPSQPELCRRALQAVGELGRVDLTAQCRELSRCEGLQDAAAIALARLGDGSTSVRDNLRSAAAHALLGTEAVGELVELAKARVGDEVDMWRRNGQHRQAIAAMEALGSIAYVTPLIGYMNDDALARRAGDAFLSMTGVDLLHDDLGRDPPAGYSSGPDDDPANACVTLDPEHHLPWPSQLAVTRWWQAHQRDFEHGVRYLAGTVYGLCADGISQTQAQRGALLEIARFGRPAHQRHAVRALGANGCRNPRIEVRAFAGARRPLPGLAPWLQDSEQVIAPTNPATA